MDRNHPEWSAFDEAGQAIASRLDGLKHGQKWEITKRRAGKDTPAR